LAWSSNPSASRGFLQTGEGTGALVEGLVEVVAGDLVGRAFGHRGPPFLLPFPVAVVGTGDHEVFAVGTVALERAVEAADDRLERAQPVLGGDRGQIDQLPLGGAFSTSVGVSTSRPGCVAPGPVPQICCR
jgi:hypothetical protein